MRAESAFAGGFDIESEIVYKIGFLGFQTVAVEHQRKRCSLTLAGVKLVGNASAVEDLEEIGEFSPIVFKTFGIIGKQINSVALRLQLRKKLGDTLDHCMVTVPLVEIAQTELTVAIVKRSGEL